MDEQVSIVVPVYNEAPAIERVISDILAAADHVLGSEVVIVDDHSTDATTGILDRMAAVDPRIDVIHAAHNRGHGASLLAGIERASRSWLFLIDADGQIDPNDFKAAWAQRADADLVMGTRHGRVEPRHRRALSSFVARVVTRLAGKDLPDPNVPFKLVRRALWEDLRSHVPNEAKTPSLLIALGAALRGWRIALVPVDNHPRLSGRSKLRVGRLLVLSVKALVELFVFRTRVRRAPPRQDTRASAASATIPPP